MGLKVCCFSDSNLLLLSKLTLGRKICLQDKFHSNSIKLFGLWFIGNMYAIVLLLHIIMIFKQLSFYLTKDIFPAFVSKY